MLNDRLPYGNAKFILGIAAIVFSPALIGFVLGAISVYLVDKDTKMLAAYRNNYSETAVKNHKQGLIIAWAGFVISLVVMIVILYFFGKYGTLDMEKVRALQEQRGM